MRVIPYLDFSGRCDEAIAFYKDAINASVPFLMRFKDSPDPNSCAPGSEEKVMHCSIQVGETELFASDMQDSGNTNFAGITLTLSVDSDEDAERYFTAIADGGKVVMPLMSTFFASKFGLVDDKFGVHWMVIRQKPM
ncbi:MAG: VOC family protein [Candidatus Hydrogenedentes bacterium]|nr:VOC family protein [Candidatus Hydrogenedentota bacterium]